MNLLRFFKQPKIPIIAGGVVTAVGVGLISMAVQQNNHGMINGFLAMSGVGVGLAVGPLASTFVRTLFFFFSSSFFLIKCRTAVHARFSQPENVVAVVVGLNMLFRTAGGTVGLAQLGTVLEAKVRSYVLSNAPPSSSIDPATFSGSVQSIDSISSLSPALQAFVKDAFQYGVRWSFVSLIPWCAISAVLVFFLSNIDFQKREAEAEGALDRKASSSGEDSANNNMALLLDGSSEEKPAGRQTDDPRPKLGFPGLVSYIIYRVQLSKWEKRQRQREAETFSMTSRSATA
jgi:hypothetical protein